MAAPGTSPDEHLEGSEERSDESPEQDPEQEPDQDPGGDQAISYEQWGVDFFSEAISKQRVLGAVNTITGQPIDFGPIGVGPGRIAKVRAYGEIGEATATRQDADHISYRVGLPVTLTFEVDLQVETHRFEADLLVPLTLTAVARPGVRIFIEATTPRGAEIQVDLQAQGLRASVLQRVVGVEAELRRFVARYVRHELEKPHVREARLIDVSRAIDKAWESLAPPPPDEAVTADLDGQLERDIRENEDSLVGDPESS